MTQLAPPITKSKRTIHHSSVTKKLKESLGIAVNEKDVENAYRQAVSVYFPSQTSSPFNMDGLLECETVRSLLEFKFKFNLANAMERCGILIQSLFYIKKFELAGKKLPTTIFVGDLKECFCLQSSVLAKYLNHPIDWSVAPSSASKANTAMLKAMVDDVDILPFIFDVKAESFQFGNVIDTIKSLSNGVVLRVKITKENIIEIFNYWRKHVLTEKGLTDSLIFEDDAKVQTARQCDIFFNCLTDKQTTYPHPRRKNILVTRGENVAINTSQHTSFFAHFSEKLSSSELEAVVANKDRIIDEVSRRRTGAFFTPSLWVAEAQKMIGEALGANWREEYVVWDCASGTNNLTRDYNFRELYCSTLEQGDVNTVKDCGYNRGSTVFQYDFLSEMELGDKVPAGLKQAFEQGKTILFFINPPYGTANEQGRGAADKAGVAKTQVGIEMKTSDCGSASQQVYAQFLYRISRLRERYGNKVEIAIFTPPAFMTGSSYVKFRKFFFERFAFNSGMLFQASNFSDVKSEWGISFTIWMGGRTRSDIDVSLKVLDPDTFMVTPQSTKTFYNADGCTAAKWAREAVSSLRGVDHPQLSCSIAVKQKGFGTLVGGALGYMTSNANNVDENDSYVFISSSCSSLGHGFSVVPDNFLRAIALFTARRTVMPDWINCKDEYLTPDTSLPSYAQWNNDAIVYALLNNRASQQSSLRQIAYKGKRWNIPNQFFFMSNSEMRKLADKAGFNDMYEDTKQFSEDAYVYNLLQTTKLSTDAQALLDEARQLIRDSMSLRETFHEEDPKYHLQAWDGGWAQLKPLFKKHFASPYAVFNIHYKELEKRLRLGVYRFGFLK